MDSLSLSSITSSFFQMSKLFFRLFFCFGFSGLNFNHTGTASGFNLMSNSIRSVFPIAFSGELKMSCYSFTRYSIFLAASGQSFNNWFSLSCKSKNRSVVVVSRSLTSLILSPLVSALSPEILRGCNSRGCPDC